MRTRFAPSPTGFLHIGGLRTALFSFLLAKQTGGSFLLRIEDTDQERSIPGAIENILSTLHWAGLDPDEGVILEKGSVTYHGSHGPYIQSQRLDLYRTYGQKLLDSGHAYPCFCSSERLEQLHREQQASKGPLMYDRLCLTLSKEETKKRITQGLPYVFRLNIPQEETITFDDEVRGRVDFKGHLIDDQVLLKSDGFPTYHLAHVVDDHLMKIDCVIRGEEWLSSLPKHILLFRAFGWKPPLYAHVPLLLNTDRTKLSKRQGDIAVEQYIEKGYLREALINFIALLGWNPGTPEEVLSMENLVHQFSLKRVQRANAIFDTSKLQWLQGQWMRKLTPEDFANRIRPLVTQQYKEASNDLFFRRKAVLIQERVTFFNEAPDMLGFFYKKPMVNINLLANEKQKITEGMVPHILDLLIENLRRIHLHEWSPHTIVQMTDTVAKEHGLTRGQVLWPLRMALTGRQFSPGAIEVAHALEYDETIARLETAREAINKQ